MKSIALITTLLLALAASPTIAGSASTTVTLEISLADPSAPSVKTCDVAIATPTTGAAVLDAAVAQGCISSWEAQEYPGYGRYVTCIDGVCAVLGTYWGYLINDETACGGVDNTPYQACAELQNGDRIEFSYQQWLTFLVPLP